MRNGREKERVGKERVKATIQFLKATKKYARELMRLMRNDKFAEWAKKSGMSIKITLDKGEWVVLEV